MDDANHDEDLVLATGEKVLKSKNKSAAKVLSRLADDPHLGEPLLKHIKKLDNDLEKMNDELGRDEEGMMDSPIKCLAYLLGFFYKPYSCSVITLFSAHGTVSRI